MKLSQYNYELNPELLAKYPTDKRDESRMLVLHRKSGKIEHRTFKDILDYFDEKDVFVFNNTKVFPARLFPQPDLRCAGNGEGSFPGRYAGQQRR